MMTPLAPKDGYKGPDVIALSIIFFTIAMNISFSFGDYPPMMMGIASSFLIFLSISIPIIIDTPNNLRGKDFDLWVYSCMSKKNVWQRVVFTAVGTAISTRFIENTTINYYLATLGLIFMMLEPTYSAIQYALRGKAQD